MSPHPTEATLHAFALGELDDATAVGIAHHLDACPRCAGRAAALDPLAEAWMDMPEPRISEAVVDEVLAAALAPRPAPWVPAAVGAGLLLAGLVLALVGIGPADLMVAAAEWLAPLPRLGVLATQVSLSLGGLVLAVAVFLTGSGVAVTLARRAS